MQKMTDLDRARIVLQKLRGKIAGHGFDPAGNGHGFQSTVEVSLTELEWQRVDTETLSGVSLLCNTAIHMGNPGCQNGIALVKNRNVATGFQARFPSQEAMNGFAESLDNILNNLKNYTEAASAARGVPGHS